MKIILPARRAFITAVIIFFSLYQGYTYLAVGVAAIFILAWFVFPVRHPHNFFTDVIPALDAMANYLRKVMYSIDQANINYNEQELLKTFYSSKSGYAEWVFNLGFNPKLRAGYRHFLIQLEHAADLCCSLGAWLALHKELFQLQHFTSSLAYSLKGNVELLTALSRTMHHHAEKTAKPANDSSLDFISDITTLEEALKQVVPGNLELLDLSPEYIAATAIVRDVKDLREILLGLTAAVPV